MRIPYNLNRTPYKTELPSVESERKEFSYLWNGASVTLAATNLVLEYRKKRSISRRTLLRSLIYVAIQERVSHFLVPIVVPDEGAGQDTDRIDDNNGLEDKLPR